MWTWLCGKDHSPLAAIRQNGRCRKASRDAATPRHIGPAADDGGQGPARQSLARLFIRRNPGLRGGRPPAPGRAGRPVRQAWRASIETTGKPIRRYSRQSRLGMAPVSKPMRSDVGAGSAARTPGSDFAGSFAFSSQTERFTRHREARRRPRPSPPAPRGRRSRPLARPA